MTAQSAFPPPFPTCKVCGRPKRCARKPRCHECGVAYRKAQAQAKWAATLPERFWAKVSKTEGCWEWQGTHDARGYGRLCVAGRKAALAHRIAWKLTHGELDDALVVCHRCDNPTCVRPDHLFIGTQADNVADMVAKGRHLSPSRWKTHCFRGHELTTDNRRGGTGKCLKCERINNRENGRRRRLRKKGLLA